MGRPSYSHCAAWCRQSHVRWTAQLAAPSSTFVQGAPGGDEALQALTSLVAEG